MFNKIVKKSSVKSKDDILLNWMAETVDKEILLLDSFDDCIIGVTRIDFLRNYVAVYSVDRILNTIVNNGVALEDARSYFNEHVKPIWAGQKTPLFVETPFLDIVATPQLLQQEKSLQKSIQTKVVQKAKPKKLKEFLRKPKQKR